MRQAGRAKDILIYGAGGHGKVVLDAARRMGWNVIGFLDSNADWYNRSILGAPVLGGMEQLEKRAYAACCLILALGENAARQEQLEQLTAFQITFATVVHPSAQIGEGAELGEGTVVLAGAVVGVEATIGRHVIINTAATVDHDCTIGDFVHIAPGAHLAGNVTVGSSGLVGIGAAVLPGTTIGSESIIGAGAVVIDDIPTSSVAYGVPAAVRRKVSNGR